MSIRCDEQNGVCVVTVNGDFSGTAAAEAQVVVSELLARPKAVNFVFDLGGCEFIDSAGLELLCRVRRRCGDGGATVALAAVRPACGKILEMTRLATRFDCHADVNGALAAAR